MKNQEWISKGGENYSATTKNGVDVCRVSEPGDILSAEPIYNGLGERVDNYLPYLVRKAQ